MRLKRIIKAMNKFDSHVKVDKFHAVVVFSTRRCSSWLRLKVWVLQILTPVLPSSSKIPRRIIRRIPRRRDVAHTKSPLSHEVQSVSPTSAADSTPSMKRSSSTMSSFFCAGTWNPPFTRSPILLFPRYSFFISSNNISRMNFWTVHQHRSILVTTSGIISLIATSRFQFARSEDISPVFG